MAGFSGHIFLGVNMSERYEGPSSADLPTDEEIKKLVGQVFSPDDSESVVPRIAEERKVRWERWTDPRTGRTYIKADADRALPASEHIRSRSGSQPFRYSSATPKRPGQN